MSKVKLTAKQLELLKCIYRYRLTNRQLIADSLGINADANLYVRLKYLESIELVAHHYEPIDRIDRRPIAYYLTAKGLRALSTEDNPIPPSVMRQGYLDKNASANFISYNFGIHTYLNALTRKDLSLRPFTRRDMAKYDYFPKSPPDAFLLSDTGTGEPMRYFLDFIPASEQRYQLDQLIGGYVRYFEEGGWDTVSDQLPAILFIAENKTVERMLRRRATYFSGNSFADIRVLSTTVKSVQTGADDRIWLDIESGEDELQSVRPDR